VFNNDAYVPVTVCSCRSS